MDALENESNWATILRVSQRKQAIAPVNSIFFQLLETDYTFGSSYKQNRWYESLIRMYGTTANGATVAVRVHGFLPYFYCDASNEQIRALSVADIEKRISIREMRENDEIAPIAKRKRHNHDDNGPHVDHIERLEKYALIAGDWTPRHVLKIYTRLPKHVPIVRSCMENWFRDETDPLWVQTYEADLAFTLRFMVDKQIAGCDWIKVNISNDSEIYVHSPDHIGKEAEDTINDDDDDDFHRTIDSPHSTWCDIEIDVNEKDVICMGHEGEWAAHAPLRIFSFDIECASNEFPNAASGDPVITIGCRITDTATPGRKNDVAVMLQLNSCNAVPVPGVITHWCDTRQLLLLRFRQLVVQSNPDLMTGYNICNFDFGYIQCAAQYLGVAKEVLNFSRVKGECLQVRIGGSTTTSRAFGTREMDSVKLSGRVPFDLLPAIRQVLCIVFFFACSTLLLSRIYIYIFAGI